MPKCIEIEATTMWDPINEEFIQIEPCSITFEHSLISISKWESKWHKPFLSGKPKTTEETVDYIRCMVINHSFNPLAINYIVSNSVLAKELNDYIEDSMTATTFYDNETQRRNNNKIVTSELIYYWMTAFQIPVEFEKWHLNRLLTLIRICSIENDPDKHKKSMGRNAIFNQNRSINAARRKAIHSRG